MAHPAIKNLIFDLGGVILDLSVNNTLQAFSDLSGQDKTHVQKIFQGSPGFELFEKGELTDIEFRDFVRKTYNISATDEQIDKCWNAMLLGLPIIKLELLKKLMKSYNVLLLSNTNSIHLNYVNNALLPLVADSNSLDFYFHRTYYSHLMRMRKPDAEIFEYVLNENEILAKETLFLDDNKHNIDGAGALGIKTVHVSTPDLILEYFS